MAKKKFKWWLLLIPVLVAVVILLAAFWDTIGIYAAPKAALTGALNDTLSRLDRRFLHNPIRNTLDVYDREGKYTAQLQLETDQELLGSVTYDMTVQTDLSGHQLQAQGNVGFSGSDLALSLYLNGDFMAISSENLLKGDYYGLSYDTFSEDLNSFPLVKRMIPTATLQKWEADLEGIQQMMNRSYKIPEITENDVRMLMTAILLLDSKVSREEVSLGGETVNSYVITYSAAGEEVKEILGYILDVSVASEAEVTASFFLYNDAVVKFEMDGTAGDNQVSYIFDLGEDAGTAPLMLQETRRENGVQSNFSLTVNTTLEGSQYQESITFVQAKNGPKTALNVSYDWDSVTGNMLLNWNDSMPIRLNLTRDADGIHLVTDDFAQLMAVVLENEKGSTASASCTMILDKGSSVTAPAYKNLDKWSFDDLLTLLGGLGSLIGIDFM